MGQKRIGIVGLGLMGGSLALALKRLDSTYYFMGLDHNPTHCEDALRLNLVDTIASTVDALYSCDIIILSIPVSGIITITQQLHDLPNHCTVIDFGSTKATISASIPTAIRPFFVTAHPMTGTEKFGPTAAIPHLYKDKVIVLCDIEKSATKQQQVAQALFESLEMKLVYMDAQEHDRHAAFISHMPHALSYALANAVMKQEDSKSIIALAGGGFKDMSRIAKSSATMWRDIFKQNRHNTLESIHTLQSELKQCEKMIESEDWDALYRWMDSANRLHDILE